MDLEIFWLFSSMKSSKWNTSGGSPPRAFTIRFETRTLSIRSLPEASKSTSSAAQRAAQSGRHCSFT